MTLGCLAAVSMVSRAWEVTSEKRQTTRLVLLKLKKIQGGVSNCWRNSPQMLCKKKDNLFWRIVFLLTKVTKFYLFNVIRSIKKKKLNTWLLLSLANNEQFETHWKKVAISLEVNESSTTNTFVCNFFLLENFYIAVHASEYVQQILHS